MPEGGYGTSGRSRRWPRSRRSPARRGFAAGRTAHLGATLRCARASARWRRSPTPGSPRGGTRRNCDAEGKDKRSAEPAREVRYRKGELDVAWANINREPERKCPGCGERRHANGNAERSASHVPARTRPLALKLKVTRLRCPERGRCWSDDAAQPRREGVAPLVLSA